MNDKIINLFDKERFTFFFRSTSPFSNWYKCKFIDGVTEFNCMEQFMMYHKSMLFRDYESSVKIMKTDNPKEHKQIGRQVKNFNTKIWDECKIAIVTRGVTLKFTQNYELRRILLSTKGTILVEASPYDKIWGCGLSEDDPKIVDPNNWTGQNILGRILTKLRNELLLEMENVNGKL